MLIEALVLACMVLAVALILRPTPRSSRIASGRRPTGCKASDA